MKNIRKKFRGKRQGKAVVLVATGDHESQAPVGALAMLLALLQRGEETVERGSLSLVTASGDELPRELEEAEMMVEIHRFNQPSEGACIMTPNDTGAHLNALHCFSVEAIIVDPKRLLINHTPCSAVEKWVGRGKDRFGLCYEVAQQGASAQRMVRDMVKFCRALGVFAVGAGATRRSASATVYELTNCVRVNNRQFGWYITPRHLQKVAKGKVLGCFADLRTPGRNGNTDGWSWGCPMSVGKDGVLVYPAERGLFSTQRRREVITCFAVKK